MIKIVQNKIDINAEASRVWEALTDPNQTKIYMFGCETISDWKLGSPLLWQGNHEGNPIVFVKGIILEIQSNVLLKYTVIDPNSGMPDLPENYLNVTYELQEQNGQTTLTVTQDGFEGAAEGEKRYQEIYNQ